MHVWTRLIRPEKLDALLMEMDVTRTAVTRRPGKVLLELKFFAEDREELLTLQGKLGGKVSEVRAQDWLAPMQKHPPIPIRDQFLLVEAFSENAPARPELMIPAGLAFGTGDHPTTATCLRFLCDVAKLLTSRQWSMLDVGCGTGVLAIAAKWLGADVAEGFDYDQRAVRAARQNAAANRIRGVRWRRADLLQFTSVRKFDVLAANIYSELFLASWPLLQKHLTSDGYFILSGILKFQASECRRAIIAAGLTIVKETPKGKWITFLAVAHG